ncbi:alpha/beta hydrolase-fold protein [Fulvivirga lutimaris]|uniref:alpha/beta hydrolase-fold protein n=1 Tax=Fulvivirga lutimaris TaxID=1819566 RepID=UPI0012BB9B18|nr:alpha/beta hydrolase-fold protein [Fulvivirga lutimaris]MTI39705.1 tetratricopeptide repeat protein [Fulvivirga lutimaris]
MKNLLLIFALFGLQFTTYAQLAEKVELTEDNKLLGLGEQHLLHSEVLGENRPIIISLPVDYDHNQENYPVIYVLDGLQNIKHTVGTVELLAESGLVPPMIIVGIESLDRARDLTPSNAGKNMNGGTGNAGIPQSGGAPRFLEFLEAELIPYIETNYRTHPYRILEGHSFGGLFGVYTLMDRPDIFDAFVIEAPALWWNNEEMTQKAKDFFSSSKELDKAVYFGIGGDDGWGMRQELIRYVDVIKQNTPKNFRWHHEEVGDEDHMASRLLLNYHGLKFLFSDLKMTEDTAANFDGESFLNAEKQLMSKYGTNTRRPAGDYVNMVMEQVNKDNLAGAITILKRATEAYPTYIGLLTYLAKLYEQSNQTEEAVAAYMTGVEVSKKYKLGQEDDLMIEIDRLRK